jgi:hypothetical protein
MEGRAVAIAGASFFAGSRSGGAGGLSATRGVDGIGGVAGDGAEGIAGDGVDGDGVDGVGVEGTPADGDGVDGSGVDSGAGVRGAGGVDLPATAADWGGGFSHSRTYGTASAATTPNTTTTSTARNHIAEKIERAPSSVSNGSGSWSAMRVILA